MTGGTVTGQIFGGYSYWDAATGNTVTITGGSTVNNSSSVYGGYSYEDAATGNTVTITGGSTVNNSSSVYGGYSNFGAATGNTVTITGGSTVNNSSSVYGGYSYWGAATGNTVTISDGSTVENSVYGGYSYCGAATGNTVTISDGTVSGDVYGGWGYRDTTDNRVTITGGTVKGNVYGGSSNRGAATGNTVALSGSADVMAASLYGSNRAGTGYENTLLIDGWSGSTKSVQNFSDITFQNIQWQTGGTVLDITNLISFAGGTELQKDDTMTFIKGNDLGIQKDNVEVADTFTAGVAAVGTGEMSVGDDGSISYTLTDVSRNTQTDLIAENRTVAAAFVNQGADIAADALWLLDDGYHFGMQTFGAVYGNRSQYDVASDIKINGWSEIAGFGNIHEVKGGRLAWTTKCSAATEASSTTAAARLSVSRKTAACTTKRRSGRAPSPPRCRTP